ncbi:MAG: hypothetical protein ACI4EW_07815 [Butyrivibrio sp.]
MGKALKIIGRILISVGGLGFIFLGKYVFFLNNYVCILLTILGVYLILRGVIECKIDEINTTEYIYGPGNLSPDEEKNILANGGWKCPDCGKINRSYETTCKCGKRKDI